MRKHEYSPSEWEAYANGQLLAETRRPIRVPPGLKSREQNAFREGYQTMCEDIKNRPVVDEIKRMVAPVAIKRLFQSLAQRT